MFCLVCKLDFRFVTHFSNHFHQFNFIGQKAVVFNKNHGISPAGKIKAYTTGFIQAILNIGYRYRIHTNNQKFNNGNPGGVGLAFIVAIKIVGWRYKSQRKNSGNDYHKEKWIEQ